MHKLCMSLFWPSSKQLPRMSSGQLRWQPAFKIPRCSRLLVCTRLTVLMQFLAFRSARGSSNDCLRAIMNQLKFHSSATLALCRVTIHLAAASSNTRVMTLILASGDFIPIFLHIGEDLGQEKCQLLRISIEFHPRWGASVCKKPCHLPALGHSLPVSLWGPCRPCYSCRGGHHCFHGVQG